MAIKIFYHRPSHRMPTPCMTVQESYTVIPKVDVGLDVGMRDDTREPIPHSRRLETEAVGLRRREKD